MLLNSIFSVSLFGAFLHFSTAAPALRSRITKRNARDVRPEALPAYHTIAVGHLIKLECSADDTLPPVIHWTHNGVLVKQGPLDQDPDNILPPPTNRVYRESQHKIDVFYTTKSTLMIRSAQTNDSGVYECVADTQTNRVTRSYTVVVSAESTRAKRAISSDDNAFIYQWTDQAFEYQGVNIRLICRSTQGKTRGAPLIKWTVDDADITDTTEGYRLHTNGDLEIISPDPDRLGWHSAEAKCTSIGDNGSFEQKGSFIYIYAPS